MDGDSESQNQEGGSAPKGGRPSTLSSRIVQEHDDALKKRARRFPLLTREQADDLVGDVWLYVSNNPEKVLKHPNPRALLLNVLACRYIDFCRASKSRSSSPGSTGSELLDQMAEEDPRFGRFENHETLRRGILTLPLPQARVIQLQLEGLTLEQIGRDQGISTAEAGRRVARAYQHLSEFIKKGKP